jgi:sulfatase-modifying factor enzyme 1
MTGVEKQASRPPGSIVTFYSYKGGTGRSMALANVAWVLASAGKRVLVVDWDLEAPGLHRYFEPFLADKTLERSTGVIDFVREFATAAVSADTKTEDKGWYREYANLLAHAVPVTWEFALGGSLDFVPAGKQDAAYAVRVNSFDWQDFYERLGGGILLEKVKENLRQLYDFVLIDSRTGVSDTSGVCTVQMPDQLVVCFTLNRQSIYGASAAARSAYKQRHSSLGSPTLKIWPVPTRVEGFEKDRLELAQTIARARFSGLIPHLDPEAADEYWGEIGVAYEPYYAYEEVLATLRDRPRQTGSMLATMVTIAGHINGSPLTVAEDLRRAEGLAAFTSRSAHDFAEELALLGGEYETIRANLESGDTRTSLMTSLVSRAQTLGGHRDAGQVAENLFGQNTDGARIVALALALKEPQRRHVEMALSAIAESRSAFEQYHGLRLVQRLLSSLEPQTAEQVRTTIAGQVGRTITEDDPGRFAIAGILLKQLGPPRGHEDWVAPVEMIPRTLGAQSYTLIECRPTSSTVRYDDVEETHGSFVVTRGNHQLRLPRVVRIGQQLVTNSLFKQFVAAEGYRNDELWSLPASARQRFVTSDGKSQGPGSWLDSGTPPSGKDEHPVSSLCYAEARAFANWCNVVSPEPNWRWTLPMEDHWEYAARSDSGLIYPWGDAFDASKCNSAENNRGDTTEVTAFARGQSRVGCYDMAGNVWEFVDASDAGSNWCVMRGGSYKNNRYEVRNYLRLQQVPVGHRPPDFGFRLAQVAREGSA